MAPAVTIDQDSGVDTVLQDLGVRIPRLVKEALMRDEIKRVVTSPKVHDTLETEANKSTEAFLQTTNTEIAEVRKAHEALAAHEGRSPGGPNPRTVSLTLLHAYASVVIVASWISAVIFVGQHSSASVDSIVFATIGILAFIVSWYAVSRVVATAQPDVDSTSGLFLAGFGFVSFLLPPIFMTSYIIYYRQSIFSSVAHGLFETCLVGLVVLGVQVIICLWIPGTRYFYTVSRTRREIMKQVGATSFWLSTIAVVFQTIPAIGPSITYLLRYKSTARSIRRGGKPLIGRSSTYPWYGERQRLESTLENALQDWGKAVIRKGILPFLRNRINEITTPPFSLELKIYDSPGLSQMSAQEYIVSTPAFARQRNAIDPLDGGIVGIAGPRGAGKTTVLQAYKAGRFLKPGEEQIVVFETVPVAYEARDFILHLYFEVCASVADFIDQHVLGVAITRRKRARSGHHGFAGLLAAFAIIWAPVFWYATTIDRDPHFKLPFWLIQSDWLIGIAVGLSVVFAIFYSKGRRERPSELYEPEVTDLRSLRELAQRRMMDIRFQQSHTFGWAGKLGMPLPYTAEFSRSHELELASKSRTYPEIVADFHRFLAATVTIVQSIPNLARVPVLIILDELDKISSTDGVREFINEAKGFMRLQGPGLLCLISVSEDALTSFEQRGLPTRDALDSAFDSIIDVGYLSLEDSIHLLNRRVIGMSPPFICLCHCLAGGLPRELIRAARNLTQANSSPLDEVCLEVILNDLRRKLGSWRTAIASSGASDSEKAELIRYLNDAILGTPTAASLLRAVENHPVLKNGVNGGTDLAAIRLQIVTYIYFAATILEVFTLDLTEGTVEDASKSSGPGSFDSLACARQQFSISPNVAWATLNTFRESWKLATTSSAEFDRGVES